MKKLLILVLLFVFAAIGANAQSKSKYKQTSSPAQTVHNAFSKHKRHNGYKIKTIRHGHKRTKVVKYKHGHAEIKTSGFIALKESDMA